MTLYFDTTVVGQLVVELRHDGVVVARHEGSEGPHHAQQLLPAIDELLRKEGLKLTDVAAIEVNPGPGSFTGTRVGVAVANALGFAMQVPVNGQPVGEGVAPEYAAPPHVTIPKK